MSQRSK